MDNPYLKANGEAWESYAASPHFTDGDRRQDFDNGWDEAIQLLRPALVLLRRWESSSASGEATDLADESDELLERLGFDAHEPIDAR